MENQSPVKPRRRGADSVKTKRRTYLSEKEVRNILENLEQVSSKYLYILSDNISYTIYVGFQPWETDFDHTKFYRFTDFFYRKRENPKTGQEVGNRK